MAESVGALMLALMREQPQPAPAGSRVPRRLRRALLRGLAKDPAARWPSMEALLAELVAIAGARRTRGLLAAGGVLVAAIVGLGPRMLLPADATVAAPVDPASSPAAAAEDGRSPSPAAVELRAHAEELHAARRTRALREHLERIAPGEPRPDDPTLAAEVLLWRGRTAGNQDAEEALLRRAHALARDSDVPSIESRAAGAMTGNMRGAHAEGVDQWLRLAWVAVERTPWDRRAAVEVAVTAAHSIALTRELDPGMSHARDVLEFADAVVGEVEPDDDAFIASQLVALAEGWLTIEEVERGLHWAFAARSLLAAVADATHPLWPETSEQIGRGLRLRDPHERCQEALVYFDEARAGYLRLGDEERAALVRLKEARCLWRLGRHEAGLEHARRASEHWATHEPIIHADQQTAHLVTGDLLVGLGRIDEARAEYERILALVDTDTSTQLVRQEAKRALERLGPPAPARRVTAR